MGASVGVAFALWGTRAIVGLLSTSYRVVSLDLSPDLRVLLFTIVVATITGILFGFAPPWRAGRAEPQMAMKARGRSVMTGASRLGFGRDAPVTAPMQSSPRFGRFGRRITQRIQRS